MAKKQFDCFEDSHITFIADQHMFFVATAAPEGRVNMAPKDSASLNVVNPNRIVWVNLTGAENETGAHLEQFPINRGHNRRQRSSFGILSA